MSPESFDLTDELLSAYMDDELDAAAKTRVELALANDVGVRVRLERMRSADAVLREEFKLQRDTHDPLVNAIMNDRALPDRVDRRKTSWPAIAAIAAGVGGLALGLVIANRSPGDGQFAMNGQLDVALEHALDRATSGRRASASESNAEIVLTFQAQDGRYCRVFRWHEPRNDAEGVACREAGAWRIMAWDSTVAGSGDFQTAGASALIDSVMDRLGGGAAFDANQEAALIDGEWQRR